jgi:ubiquinone/menaquinone biosynthesis C-methylase UbiE
MEKNQAAYNNEEVVIKYRSEQNLQPAEKAIFNIIKHQLSECSVLDIGVGTGRTTIHVAPLCRSYTGVDYAPNMIEYCKKTFNYSNASFDVCDARDMHQFKNEEFDTVIFSFNGIDCVAYEDRSRILKEINRVLKPGGNFIFSTHNARNLEKKYSFNMPRNPLNYFKEKTRLENIRKHNGSIEKYKSKDYFLLFDGVENDWTMSVVYIMPEFQVQVLELHHFSQFRFFNRITGKEVTQNEFSKYKEPWLYYLCTKTNAL